MWYIYSRECKSWTEFFVELVTNGEIETEKRLVSFTFFFLIKWVVQFWMHRRLWTEEAGRQQRIAELQKGLIEWVRWPGLGLMSEVWPLIPLYCMQIQGHKETWTVCISHLLDGNWNCCWGAWGPLCCCCAWPRPIPSISWTTQLLTYCLLWQWAKLTLSCTTTTMINIPVCLMYIISLFHSKDSTQNFTNLSKYCNQQSPFMHALTYIMHSLPVRVRTHTHLSLIHIWRCRRDVLCRSRWSPYH